MSKNSSKNSSQTGSKTGSPFSKSPNISRETFTNIETIISEILVHPKFPKSPNIPIPPKSPDKPRTPDKLGIKKSSPNVLAPYKLSYDEDDIKPPKPPANKNKRKSAGPDHAGKVKFNLTENIEESRAETVIKKIKEGANIHVVAAYITDKNINYQDREGNTFLMHAIKNEDLLIVGTLLDRGANVNLQNGKGNTALMIAIKSKNFHPGIVEPLLMRQGINLDLKNAKDECALTLAIKRNNPDIVKTIIEKEADFNLLAKKGTLFTLAVKNNNLQLVELILQREKNLSYKEIQKFDAFLTVCQKGLEKMAIKLIKYNCDLPEEITPHFNNYTIKQLIKIAKFVDESYGNIMSAGSAECKLKNIENDYYDVFCSRLLHKIKQAGLAPFNTYGDFCKAYLTKFKSLFAPMPDGEKFLTYLESQFQREDDFIKGTEHEIHALNINLAFLKVMDPTSLSEGFTLSARKKLEGLEKAIEFSKLLGGLVKNPYNGGSLKKLNEALTDEQTIRGFIKKYPVIRIEFKNLNEELIKQGIVLIKLNDLINKKIPTAPNPIQLITEEETNPHNYQESKVMGGNTDYSVSDTDSS